MTQIVGTLKDSGGNPLSGKLIVTLTGTMIETSSTPDSIHLVEPREFTITNGVVNIELQESETKKITYTFQFYKLDIDGELIEPALLRFNALVPNVDSVEFASLTPSGIVNDSLDTGAIRVASVIANNPNLAQNIGGVFPRGAYDQATLYKRGDIVTYLNRSYIAKNIVPTAGVLPTDELFWQLFPIEPDGNLILGSPTVYNSTWIDSGLAPSQNSVYDAIEGVKNSITLKANILSPVLTGNPIAPTQTKTNNSTRIATTAFVQTNLADFAPLISAALTGNPTAPTQVVTDNSTSIATTAFVRSCFSGIQSDGNSLFFRFPGTNILVKFNSTVINLNESGAAIIGFGEIPVFNGSPIVITCNGDTNAGGSSVGISSTTSGSFTLSVNPNPGAIPFRINWIAIGTTNP